MATMESSEDIQDHMAEDKVLQLKLKNSSILDSFEGLGSNVERNRVTAGIALLRHLHWKQSERQDGNICLEINYALKRLIRGVSTTCTDRKAGFFSVLVEVFKLFHQITTHDILNLVDLEFKPNRSCTKKELTEIYGGQVFVFGAFIRSNKFWSASPEEQNKILELLISAGHDKNIFLSCVYCFLVELMNQIDKVKFKDVIWQHVKPELTKSWEEHSAESLYLLLESRDRFPEVVKKTFLFETLGTKEVLNEESIHLFSKLLMDSPLMILNDHPFYVTVCRKVSSSPLLVSFWESLVKEVEKRPSRNREQALIKILGKLVAVVDKTQIPLVLCDGFMEFVFKTLQSKKSKKDLAKEASALFTKITCALESSDTDEDTKISFIKRLLQHSGRLTFDALAGKKIVIQLCSSMSMKGIDEIGKLLKIIISSSELKVKNSKGETCPWNKIERIRATQLFSKLLNLPTVQENLQWKIKQLKFLISQGFILNSNKQTNDFVNLNISSEVRDNFFKVLDPKLLTVDQLITLLSSLVHHINDFIIEKHNSSKLCQPLSKSSIAAWKKMYAVVNELMNVQDSETGSTKSGRKLFAVLFLFMGLHLLQDALLAEEALQELHSCYERTTISSTESKKKKKNLKTANGENEPYWVEVIVDLFLLLLSRNSIHVRHVVVSIFPYLCPYITATSLHQLLEVLNPNAKKPLTNDDDDEDNDSTSSEESDIEDENSNKQDIDSESEDEESNAAAEDEDDDDDDEDDDDDDEDDDDDDEIDDNDNEQVNDQLKMAVQNALKKTMNNSDKDSDEESLDMDQMSKEERNRLDTALSEAFKLIKHIQTGKKNKKQSKDDEAIMHFRIRVLDLIEVYLSNKPELSLVLVIMQSLFDLLELCFKDSHQNPLENRVRRCLNMLTHLKQFSSTVGVDKALLGEMLRKLLQKGERVAAVYQNMSGILHLCSAFLARTYLHLTEEGTDEELSTSPILDVYREALASFFTNRNSLLPVDVFKTVLVLHWKGAWVLAEAIMQYAFSTECRPFRRSQALKLLAVYFCNRRLIQDSSDVDVKKLKQMEKEFGEKSAEVLQGVICGKQNKLFIVKEKYIEELLQLLLTIHKLHKKNEANIPSGIHWESLMEMIVQYWLLQPLATDTKFTIKKLSRELNMNLPKKSSNEQKGSVGNKPKKKKKKKQKLNPQVAKRNSINDSEEDEHSEDNDIDKDNLSDDTGDKGYVSGNNEEVEQNKERKRPMSQNIKGRTLLKKQAKESRLACLSQGLQDELNFAEVNLHSLQEISNENGNGNEVSKGRKRKSEESSENKHKKKHKKSAKSTPTDALSESKYVRKFNMKLKRLNKNKQLPCH